MNIYATIILASIVVDFIIGLVADILNLKSLKPKPPEGYEDVYDEEKYRKSQEYTKERTKFGFVTGTFDLIVLLVFWFAGGFNILDIWVRSFGYGEIVNGLIYIGILMIAKLTLSLPFSVYSTFVIEEKFGFNKTTLSTFISDLFKSLLLSVIIGLPLLASILAFFENAGAFAWLYCWIGLTLFSVFMQFVAPSVILPLFNKFEPLKDGELKDAIMSYANSVKFSVKDLFVMDGSKRSTKSNAFFSGFGKFKKIALFDTLIEKHTTDELVAVLAHEIGHYKKKHVLQSLIISVLQSGVILYCLSIFLTHKGLFNAFYIEKTSIYTGLIFFSFLLGPLEMLLSVVMQALSRKNEYEADAYAVRTTKKPQDLINTLKKLSADNLSNLTPHPFYAFLHYSHPSLIQRVKAIKTVEL